MLRTSSSIKLSEVVGNVPVERARFARARQIR